MSYSNPFVIDATATDRASFYRKTYGLVAVSCFVFGIVLAGLLSSPIAEPLTQLLFGNGSLAWLLVLGAFWGISILANKLAFGGVSQSTQLAGLGIYIIAEAILFTPLINICLKYFGATVALNEIIMPAGLATALLAAGLTATVFMTKTDFSFLRAFVSIGFFVALGAIIIFSIFGINPGTWFIVAMIGFMAIAILYQTWQIKTQFRSDQHVGAALVIFAGIATMFWYFIQLFMSKRD